MRGTALASCAAVVAAGMFLAVRGGSEDSEAAPPQPTLDVVFVPPTATRDAPALPAAPTVGAEAPTPPSVTASPTEAGAGPLTMVPVGSSQAPTAVQPVVPTPAPPTAAADLPRYRDIEVLAMAANAVLPSGLTFRQCMELPPGEGWPFSVHLYYLGGGDWMVETHVSEVQVVFHEGSGSYVVRNFQPVNPACR